MSKQTFHKRFQSNQINKKKRQNQQYLHLKSVQPDTNISSNKFYGKSKEFHKEDFLTFNQSLIETLSIMNISKPLTDGNILHLNSKDKLLSANIAKQAQQKRQNGSERVVERVNKYLKVIWDVQLNFQRASHQNFQKQKDYLKESIKIITENSRINSNQNNQHQNNIPFITIDVVTNKQSPKLQSQMKRHHKKSKNKQQNMDRDHKVNRTNRSVQHSQIFKGISLSPKVKKTKDNDKQLNQQNSKVKVSRYCIGRKVEHVARKSQDWQVQGRSFIKETDVQQNLVYKTMRITKQFLDMLQTIN